MRHILEAVDKIVTYASVGHDRFLNESHWHDAVVCQLEIIGEATKNLSRELRARERDVPWKRMAGMRDVLIHGYMGVDLEAVWAVVQNELPPVRECVQRVLRGFGASRPTE